MANIQNYLDDIKKALFGREVRSSIHDAIEAINNETERTTASQEHLDGTFKQLIINAGQSNAEVVDARVEADGTTHATLGDRLDSMHSNIDITNKEVIAARTDKKGTIHKDLKTRLDDVDSQLEHNVEKISALELNTGDFEEFGAIGDGISDDTDAIQKVLDLCGTIYLNNKTYKITRALNINKAIKIKGKGTFISTSNDNAININAENVIIDGITILGEGTTKIGIKINNNGSIIRNCTICECTMLGIQAFNSSGHLIENNKIYNIGDLSVHADMWGRGGIEITSKIVSLEDQNKPIFCKILNNDIRNTQCYGIAIHEYSDIEGLKGRSNHVVNGNYVDNSSYIGIAIFKNDDSVINNNIVKNCIDNGIDVQQSNNTHIIGNKLLFNGKKSAKIGTGANLFWGTDSKEINNNTVVFSNNICIKGNSDDEKPTNIFFYSIDYSEEYMLSNVLCDSNTLKGGINGFVNCKNSIFSSNNCFESPFFITNSRNINVINNIFNEKSNLQLRENNIGTLIEANTFINAYSKDKNYAIYLTSPGSISYDYFIQNNIFKITNKFETGLLYKLDTSFKYNAIKFVNNDIRVSATMTDIASLDYKKIIDVEMDYIICKNNSLSLSSGDYNSLRNNKTELMLGITTTDTLFIDVPKGYGSLIIYQSSVGNGVGNTYICKCDYLKSVHPYMATKVKIFNITQEGSKFAVTVEDNKIKITSHDSSTQGMYAILSDYTELA